MSTESINPFDILSGKVAQNNLGIFYFKEAGVNVYKDGSPIRANLHRENDLPAAEWRDDGEKWWYVDGKQHRTDGPAVVRQNNHKWWYIKGECLKAEFVYYINGIPVVSTEVFTECKIR